VHAALDPFPTVLDPQIHRPAVGSSLTLRCNPPASYPPGTVYWGETNNGPKLRPIENTNRVSLDYEGKLHDLFPQQRLVRLGGRKSPVTRCSIAIMMKMSARWCVDHKISGRSLQRLHCFNARSNPNPNPNPDTTSLFLYEIESLVTSQ